METAEYSPFFYVYDGLGDPGYKHMQWHYVEYLRLVAKDAGKYEKDLSRAADRIQALESLAGVDTSQEIAEPYQYYPQETQ